MCSALFHYGPNEHVEVVLNSPSVVLASELVPLHKDHKRHAGVGHLTPSAFGIVLKKARES